MSLPQWNTFKRALGGHLSALQRLVVGVLRLRAASRKSVQNTLALKACGILRRQRDVASGRVSRHIAVGATLPGPASRRSRGQTGETERNCAGRHYERRFVRINRDFARKMCSIGVAYGYGAAR